MPKDNEYGSAAAIYSSAGCMFCPIRKSGICADCGRSDFKLLDAHRVQKRFEKGEVICESGSTSDFVGLIRTGVVSLLYIDADDSETVVRLLTPPCPVGTVTHHEHDFRIRAESKVTLCAFDRRVYEEEIIKIPAVARRLPTVLMKEIVEIQNSLIRLHSKVAQRRVASFLMQICRDRNLIPSNRNEIVSLQTPVSQELVASYLGISTATMSREITKLKRDHIIQIDGHRKITITDFPQLRELAMGVRRSQRQ